MDRYVLFVFLSCLVTFAGCGSGTSQVAENTPPASKTIATDSIASPTDVVSQFLDEVRRGGEDSRANDLLTKRAQSELKRIGRSVQPLGFPDGSFVVTRAEAVPGEDRSALVHSIWSEPSGDGTSTDFQVVWAVEQEPVGWRISGLALELSPGQDPMIVDFENGDLMAKLLSEGDSSSQVAGGTQAAGDRQTLSR